MMKKLLFILSGLLPLLAVAEDIEIYLGNETQRVGTKPKVLMIFDNSGSMGTNEDVKQPYDADTNYPATGGNSKLSGSYIYYSKGSGLDSSSRPVPDSPTEQRRFLEQINSCETARERLDTVGFYTGYIREYDFNGNSGSWQEVPDDNGANIEILDCYEDIQLLDNKNNGEDPNGNDLPNGYPIDGAGSLASPVYYTSNVSNTNTSFGIGEIVTLYTDNYLRWATNDGLPTVRMSRMDIAKASMTTLIQSTPGVDFGLQIFNLNHSGENTRDGGRVVYGLKDLTLSDRSDLVDLINDDLDPQTNTPLCETLYEALQYFGGKPVYYGDDDSDRGSYDANEPPRDRSIETSGTYISPFAGCSNDIYVIMMTDGAPTRDQAADDEISGLTGIGLPMDVNGTDNYLAALAGWMKENDINDNADGKQTSTLFTVGFGLTDEDADEDDPDSDPVKLLKQAAENGGGAYYNASNPETLLSSLQSAVIEILKVDSSFTAPSVSTNNFDSTETSDWVYYAMFTPDEGPRWQGNLKKLGVSGQSLIGADGNAAIDSNGNIDIDAQTYWSSTNDGGTVEEGGVVEMFSAMNPSDRKIYSDLGAGGSLKLFTKANAAGASAFANLADLASEMGIDETEIDAYLDWAIGRDVDDEDDDGSTTDMRKDVFGDPLHSKPLVINYGDEDLRVVIGTNAGALHMFNDKGDTVEESWAIMPKEFFKNIAPLRENSPSADKIYGLDGTPVAYLYDANKDGIISASDGDKAWIFVGLRRGGSSYYAINVSNPDSPSMMWHIDETSTGFAEMGQSWSTPRVTFSKINASGGTEKPVLVFGAGYSTAKDTAGVGAPDSVGRGVYMVDAETGGLLWNMTPSTSPSFPGEDSIPSSVAILDSDSTGYVDRLYVGDTGGMVWRIDLVGEDTSEWSAIKLASLGHVSSETEDRRFFAEPTIARALITETFSHTETDADGNSTTKVHQTQVPYDAILIGSGDRTSPLDTNTLDKLFMIKDENIITQKFDSAPDVIELSDLYDYTNNPFQGLNPDSVAYKSLALTVSTYNGWFVDLVGTGEKSVAKPEALAGVAYFNAFIPSDVSANSCTLDGGEAFVYALDLALGVNIYTERKLEAPGIITDIGIPLIVVDDPDADDGDPDTDDDPRKEIRLLLGDPVRPCDANGDCGLIFRTTRSHLFVDEGT